MSRESIGRRLLGKPASLRRRAMPGAIGAVVGLVVLLSASEMVPVIADHSPVPRLSLSWPFPRPTDPAPFAAGGSLLAAIVAAWGVIGQSRRARHAAGLASLWRLADRWDAEEMVEKRKVIAAALLASREPLRRRTLLDVLNEFEMLGFLVCTSKALPLRDAWEFFSQWALAYWFAAKPDIDLERATDETFYSQYHTLVQRLAHYEGRRSRPKKTADAVLAAYVDADAWRVAMFYETKLGEDTLSR